jgi:hypothetical protein
MTEHVHSAEHRRKLNPHHRVTKAERRRAHSAAIRGRTEDTYKVSVSKYRRRLPLDGPAKVVRVRHYWRDRFAGYGGGVSAAAVRAYNKLLRASGVDI